MSAGESAKTAIITGVTGQDGSYLAELLLGKGYRVVGLMRRSATNNTANIRHLLDDPELKTRLVVEQTDITDPFALRRLLAHVEAIEVYHLAAQSHVGLSFEIPISTVAVNALGTLNLLEAVRDLGLPLRMYQAGSSEMFGRVQATPQNESTPFCPLSPYASAKVLAHHLVVNYRESYGLHASNGILFNHESPRRGAQFVTKKVVAAAVRIQQGKQKRLQLGNLDAKRDWGYAPEYVDAMWRMLQQDQPDDYVIATGESHSVRDLVETAFALVDLDWRDHVDLDPAELRPNDVPYLLGDAGKAERVLGWRATVRFHELIRRMIQAQFDQPA